ncbi:MAG: GNAT family N-acetyltransferase [Pyrinomonadaceae bacterium]|nr:GNAT family N-acetyltransferase [Pyrinomonadaceae bacterium]
MKILVTTANDADAAEIAVLRTSVAEHLTSQHGRGHWSSCVTEKSVLRAIKTSRVLVARNNKDIVGTLSLQTKKPWAIDVAYFTSVRRALYLTNMAVAPDLQRQGIGRRLMKAASAVAREWPSEAIRLDAYDGACRCGKLLRQMRAPGSWTEKLSGRSACLF